MGPVSYCEQQHSYATALAMRCDASHALISPFGSVSPLGGCLISYEVGSKSNSGLNSCKLHHATASLSHLQAFVSDSLVLLEAKASG